VNNFIFAPNALPLFLSSVGGARDFELRASLRIVQLRRLHLRIGLLDI